MPDFLVENALVTKPYHFSLFSPLAYVYLTRDHYDIIYDILQMKWACLSFSAPIPQNGQTH